MANMLQALYKYYKHTYIDIHYIYNLVWKCQFPKQYSLYTYNW